MDYYSDELGAISGQGFQKSKFPESNSISSPNWINILSSNSITSFCTSPAMAPPQQHKPVNDHSKFPKVDSFFNPDKPSSAPLILNFGAMNPSESLRKVNNIPEHENLVSEVLRCRYSINSEKAMQRSKPTRKKPRTRQPSQTHEHIIAERRRREQLSQLFIALSAIVPGQKKTDKTSILRDSIKYLQHLQERVVILEQKSDKQAMDPVVVVKKSQMLVDGDEGSSEERSGSSSDEPMWPPEIEARAMNNNILLRIQCGKQKGVLASLLKKVESLNLIVVNTNVTPFGSAALDITIIAEMEREFRLTVTEVATAIRGALQPPAP